MTWAVILFAALVLAALAVDALVEARAVLRDDEAEMREERR